MYSGMPTCEARTGRMRDIQRIESDPEPPGLQQLVGLRSRWQPAQGHRRRPCPKRSRPARPLYLLLDDLAGASLISGFAFFKWAKQVPRDQEPRRPLRRARSCATSARDSAPGRVRSRPEGTIDHVSDNTPHPLPLGRPRRPARLARAAPPSCHRHAPRPAHRRLVGGRERCRSTPCSATASGIPKASSACCTSTRCWAGPTRTARCAPSPPFPESCPTWSVRWPRPTRRGWRGRHCVTCAVRCCSD